ncbi:MAG: carbamoyl phosphate synthase small subunit [Clostridia bacterium]|nr:carbamoyl phosphate synthase small subunit [Clostridia bacterium]
MKAYLTLENGKVFCGEAVGAICDEVGEIVFSTSMGSYIEALTDPCYYGQILVQTYPLIGNYGMIHSDMESSKIHAKGYIVREICDTPSNFRCEGLLEDFLKEQGVMGISGIDTREITKIIREEGTMTARISTKEPSGENLQMVDIKDAVKEVSAKEKHTVGDADVKIALLDLGTTKSAVKTLANKGAQVTVLPYNTKADELLSYDAIYLSDGPGNPEDCNEIVEVIKEIFGKKPIFATGLGHQLLAMANGAKIHKLPYGHRGANQPVKQLESGRVYITAQNHSYAVANDTLPSYACVTYENLNDKSCEGIEYTDKNAVSIQFRPIAGDGPNETDFLYKKFFEMIGGSKNA